MAKCIECKTKESLVAIFKRGTNNGTEEDFSKKMICEKCLEESDDFGVCPLCYDDAAYHEMDLIEGYCREHYDEVTPSDDEERDGWESLGEYWADPSHWSED